ncbi:MAG TPA: ribosome-associated translation inhibitor RaiA [Alphaproteobacteria bacterium]|nr:ribosome-associated translation inhibitor RaiA [Alphaproteobacteria bacterium]USO05322.1 MAG: ribosome-associated translation inhibitor RaiA [Rhodospirillales bacterium]HOO81411.1 ribosome-associated translation inhibitor RaiA [Alphaproteobacteria bacterium]
MELNVHGKQIDVGDALRTHVEDKLEDLNQKYFNHATFATVTFSREGHGKASTKAHISVQLGKNIMVVADATDPDPYASFEAAAEKVGKQMRRYKRKLRDHHERLEQTPENEIFKARDYVLAAASEQDDEPEESLDQEPLVIAEMTKDIETMSVSEAVMRLDLSGEPFLVFFNAKNGTLNIVHAREDGNIGWIDPENGEN